MIKEEMDVYKELNSKFYKRCFEIVEILKPLNSIFDMAADGCDIYADDWVITEFILQDDMVECIVEDQDDSNTLYEHFPSYLIYSSDEEVIAYKKEKLEEKYELQRKKKEQELEAKRKEYEKLKKIFEK